MTVEIQVPAEGMWHRHDQQANTVFVSGPLAYDRVSHCREVVQQMAVLPKDRPEDAGHRKNKARIGNIWKCSPLLSLPQDRGAIPTTRTSTRLASVVDQFLFGF